MTAENAETGELKPFYVEFFTCNPALAEDEPVNQQVIGKLLGMAGFSYDIAENGEKAIELFKQKNYDAALFDVQMPVMDGIEATNEIRKLEGECYSTLPIIALTANVTEEARELFLKEQMNDFVAKPIRSVELKKC